MKNIIAVIGILVFCGIGGTSSIVSANEAKEHCGSDCTSCHNLSLKEAAALLKDVGEVKSVKNAAVKGLYEVIVEREGRQGLAYIDYSKKFLIPGPIFSLVSKAPITEPPQPPRKDPQKVSLASIPLDHTILVGNPKGTKKLIVFTDPDCPYCRRLHEELKKLVALRPDVAIYVKMYPLPMHANAYDKARSLVESGSSEMLDAVMSGKALPVPARDESKKIVDASISFANSIGVNSTPTIVLPDGTVSPGARNAESLSELLK